MAAGTVLWEILQRGREADLAIGAPGRTALDHAGLRTQIRETVARLNGFGIGRGDRVAIVLPNGPEAATSFVSVGAGATTAPLNPAYREDEYEFYISDLGAKAVIVSEAEQGPVLTVARRHHLPVLRLLTDPQAPAGTFHLEPESPLSGSPAEGGFAAPDDIALVLHTSGTTSRPKIVPLRQRNLAASAGNIAAALALTPADRCLNIMPLFHIHGLIGATLSSLSTGAGVICTPGFNALKFFAWLEEAKPTWYSAVPTMHQAILARAERNRATAKAARLRLIRSSSSSLPPQVMAALEEVFGAPVIEAYGMTEASHQMASNPLPPRARKPGSVGLAAGPEITILDEAGNELPRGQAGEVSIRGPNVTSGYENNPDANAKAFTNGWFRTGDQGTLDAEGYLRLTGRLKEQINRGGEKISPLEIDVVLMDHPAVQQVVTFGMPHDKLGEEVAAAVVLREGQAASERELKEFAAKRLADFKVPRTFVFLSEIPKGATGKMQRIGLADKLGLGKSA